MNVVLVGSVVGGVIAEAQIRKPETGRDRGIRAHRVHPMPAAAYLATGALKQYLWHMSIIIIDICHKYFIMELPCNEGGNALAQTTQMQKSVPLSADAGL